MNYYLDVMRKYATFSGRAGRGEYWFFFLFYLIGYAICFAVDMAVFGQNGRILSSIFSIAHLLPSLAVGVRRLHDTDRSGWWFLIAFTGIGGIVLIVWYCYRGTIGPNRFGYAASDQLVAA